MHRALVLGKRPTYFEEPNLAWPNMLTAAADSMPTLDDGYFPYDNGLPFDIAVAAKLDRDTSEFKRKERFLELGPFSGAEWFQEVAKSKLMVRSSFSTLAC
jgi:hypothetical protein